MDMYELLDLYLEVHKDIKSVLYVTNHLEKSYSEESSAEQKYLCNILQLSICQVENKLKNAIKSQDEYIIKNSTKNI